MDPFITKYLNAWKNPVVRSNIGNDLVKIESKIKNENVNEKKIKSNIRDKWKSATKKIIKQNIQNKYYEFLMGNPNAYDQKQMETLQPPPYGTCDDPDQFYQKYSNFNGIVDFKCFERKIWPDWRWHKHGEYIGNIDHHGLEYLGEANGENGKPLIDVQYSFVITSNKPKGF